MKVAFFFYAAFTTGNILNGHNKDHEIIFFEVQLNEQTVKLANGCNAVCAFVNDQLNASVVKLLAGAGVKIIAMRCAGFNNVDLYAAKENIITVVRVPAYSPHAVAEML